jgi:hypothetical protein
MPPLSATGGSTVTGFVGQPFTANLATFVDTGGLDLPDPSDYLAAIDWGDGTTSDGTISNAGTFTVQVMISDVDGAVAATSSTATVTSPAARAIPPGGRNNLGMPFPLSAFGMVLGEEQLLSANGKAQKADPQPMNTATTPGPNGPGTPFPAQVSNPLESRRQVRGSDTYWRDLYWQQREQASDPNGWAAHELALALIETTS